jgi:deazaflavin-dependent oxidoreductase (nitroreductase family)
MRKLMLLTGACAVSCVAARWWRQNRRVGAEFVNRVVNPWLESRGFVSGSRGELALIEHVGRVSGTVRLTPIHPMPTEDGFRIIVPIGDRSQWARNVLAAGRARLQIGDRLLELDDPVFERPADVGSLPAPVRALFEWLGFRYLRLRTVRAVEPGASRSAAEIVHRPRHAVAA